MESETFPYSHKKPCLYQMKLIAWVEQWQKVSLLVPDKLQPQAQPQAQRSSHTAHCRAHTEHPMEAAARQNHSHTPLHTLHTTGGQSSP